MTDRLTPEFTEKLVDAFGETGVVGEDGELIVKEILESFVLDDQLCWVDVKNNLHDGKDVCIDWPKLSKSKATYWIHLNRDDHSDWVIYRVDDMVEHLQKRRWLELHWLTRQEVECVS